VRPAPFQFQFRLLNTVLLLIEVFYSRFDSFHGSLIFAAFHVALPVSNRSTPLKSDPSVTVVIPATVPSSRHGQRTAIAPVSIGTRDLSCWVKNKNDKRKFSCCGPLKPGEQAEKQLLDKVSFEARPGQLTAIMGPSGSGKTTLLDCIADRMHVGRTKGDVAVNGVPIARLDTKLKVLAGYVKQKDLLFSTATVRETITYAAKMRLPAVMSEKEKLDRVEVRCPE
jgi:ABC-type multidrug transport system fused ATPase/permease subunit